MTFDPVPVASTSIKGIELKPGHQKVVKTLRNGKIIIERSGKQYDSMDVEQRT